MRVIGYMRRRQAWWGANPGGSTKPSAGWPDPDFVFTGGQGCGGTPPVVPGAHAGARCPGQTEAEYRTEFSIWALAGGSLVIAVEPRNMTAFQYSTLANSEVLEVFKDTSGFAEIAMVGDGSPAATAAARQGTRCNVTLLSQRDPGNDQCVAGKTYGCERDDTPTAADNEQATAPTTMWVSGQCRGLFSCAGAPAVVCEAWSGERASCPCVTTQVWTRPLASAGAGTAALAAAVALFNPTDQVMNATVAFAQVQGTPWSSATKLDVRDLWAHESLAAGVTGSFSALVEPHGTRLLRLSATGAKWQQGVSATTSLKSDDSVTACPVLQQANTASCTPGLENGTSIGAIRYLGTKGSCAECQAACQASNSTVAGLCRSWVW
eukprot:SAG22_NODE_2355_length_2672_cov_1.682472_3_plen_379_part_00